MKSKSSFAIFIFVMMALAIVIFRHRVNTNQAITALKGSQQTTETMDTIPDSIPEDRSASLPAVVAGKDAVAAINDKPENDESVSLTSGNFDSFILKCFQGEKCHLGEDPWKMYQDFLKSGNRLAADHLISFLRSKLKDPSFRDQYSELLKRMIGDFYPPEERQFQEAAFYNYRGDLQKSLDLYLDLQKKSRLNPNIKSAPTLNIANTLYDMKRYEEALPYYEIALKEYLSGQQKSEPSPVDMIEERIALIKSLRR